MLKKRAKHGAKWTPEEDAVLRARCEAGDYLEDISRDLERSIESVRTRANVLGIACRSGRGLRNRAGRLAGSAVAQRTSWNGPYAQTVSPSEGDASMSDPQSAGGAKQPGEQDKRNEADAGAADRKTIANVQKNESDKEKTEPTFRPPS